MCQIFYLVFTCYLCEGVSGIFGVCVGYIISFLLKHILPSLLSLNISLVVFFYIVSPFHSQSSKSFYPLLQVSGELIKVLLHLGHDHSVPLRFSAMLALTVTCPKTTATYLTEQVYERNYNTRHRVDILQVSPISCRYFLFVSICNIF